MRLVQQPEEQTEQTIELKAIMKGSRLALYGTGVVVPGIRSAAKPQLNGVGRRRPERAADTRCDLSSPHVYSAMRTAAPCQRC